MALIVSMRIEGNAVVSGCYVRIHSIDVVKKDRTNGTFYATCKLATYRNASEAAQLDDDGSPSGLMLATAAVQRIKVTGVNIAANIHQQLYAKLKTDLTAASITWAEE